MEVVRYQVVVVGAGCAGLRALIEAARTDRNARMVCVSKHHALHAGGGPGGGTAAALDDTDMEAHAADTVRGSSFLADQDAVEVFASTAPAELDQLGRWGCPWAREPDGQLSVRRMGGMERARAWFVRDRTVAHVRRTLLHKAFQYDVDWLHEHMVTKLLVDDGRVCGVAVLNFRTGQLKAVLGQSVVLATGGAGRLFAESTAGGGETGDGMALAYRAGVALRDLEFVQVHPTGLVPGGRAVSEAARSLGGALRNAVGERFLDQGRRRVSELGRRDRVARSIAQEILEGRGVRSEIGPGVELDLRALDAGVLARQLPTVCQLAEQQAFTQPVRSGLLVRPYPHRLLGGIAAGLDGETSLPGLYAVGDVASSGIHGASGLAGNALSAALVFAGRAGRAAVRWAGACAAPAAGPLVDLASAENTRIERIRSRKSEERERTLRGDLGRVLDRSCGVFRDAARLRTAVREVAALKERYTEVSIEDRSEVFNMELVRALELGHLLDVGEALAMAALERPETRGAHARTDFRSRNDERFLMHSLVTHHPAVPQVHYAPVTIKRWTPSRGAR